MILSKKSRSTNDWPIILTAGIGLFLSTLDTGIINVALPTLIQTFHTSVSAASWTVTLYLLTLSTTVVVFGRLSDQIGRLRIFGMGLIVFAVTSILCGAAISAEQLIIYRGLQGIGAAMLQATSAAIITTCIPKDRQGTALGTLGMILGLGNVLGPGVGGLLLSFVGWRWVFWINIPICAAGLLGITKLLKATRELKVNMSPNFAGNFLLGLTAFVLLFGISGTSLHGINRLLLFGIFVISLIGYILWENHASQPIIPLSLFRNGAFTVPFVSALVLGISTSITFIIPAYFLDQVTHLPSWEVGLINLSAPLGVVMLSQFSGKLIAKNGVRQLTVLGFTMMFIALIFLSLMQLDWQAKEFCPLLLLFGAGAGIFIPANLTAIMNSVGHDLQGTMGSVQRMLQNMGLAIGAATATSMIQNNSIVRASNSLSVLREIWIIAAITVLIALFGMAWLQLSHLYFARKKLQSCS